MSRASLGKKGKGGERTQVDLDTHRHVDSGRRGRRDRQRRTHAGALSLALSRSLATLVTPTTSTPVQDNISLIFPLVFHLASTHLGRGTQQQIHWLVDGPCGSETPTRPERISPSLMNPHKRSYISWSLTHITNIYHLVGSNSTHS
jgi:hypothetical protein